jgi:hypothetical protein
LWSVANSVARITVGDSTDTVNGVPNQILNALPFASANDPRLPVLSGKVTNPVVATEDVSTPAFLSQLWKGQFDPLVLASGVDARMIEAEAAFNANGGTAGDITNMMTILNAIRAAPPALAAFQPAAMAALPTPPDKPTALQVLFREKAFWTFGRGQRLPDLRRLIRQYGLTEDKVFPKGVFFKGGNYGTDVNMPIPNSESVNPLFTGCIDRKA